MTINHTRVWYVRMRWVLYIIALLICVIPTLIAALCLLPVIVTKQAESTLSGVFTVALAVGVYPLLKGLFKVMKSPSAPVICWILYAIMLLFDKMEKTTIHSMTIVFFVAALSNTLALILFKISDIFKEKAILALRYIPNNTNGRV